MVARRSSLAGYILSFRILLLLTRGRSFDALNVEESRFDSVVVLGGKVAEAIFDGGGNFAGEGYFG